ncbi:MAG: gliding motility-associated C-terminal domain-containing protein [Chitinophagaceae bacterium]|nr:MAG: gliding motility-associated C-terminal domain-containing protein [Chitinophagaceae bacterium]
MGITTPIVKTLIFTCLSILLCVGMSNAQLPGPPGCNTRTFYNHLRAGAGESINVSGIQSTPSGQFIATGTLTDAGGQEEGLVFKINHDGSTTSPVKIRINNQPTRIQSLNHTYDGKAIIGGLVQVAGLSHGFVALLENDLSLAWVKLVQLPSATIKTTVDFTYQQDVIAAFQYAGGVALQSLSLTGTLQWKQQVSIPDITELVGIRNDISAELLLAVNIISGGKHLVSYHSFLPANGSSLGNTTSGEGAEEFKALHTTNQGYQFQAGITRDASGIFQFYTHAQNSAFSVNLIHRFTVPGSFDWSSTAAIATTGQAAALCVPQDGLLYTVFNPGAAGISTTSGNSYSVPVGSSVAGMVRSRDDGGWLMAVNTAGNDEVLLVKTDSAGLLPGCGSTRISLGTTRISNLPNNLIPDAFPPLGFAVQSGTAISISTNLGVTSDCNETVCPRVPPEDTCLNSFYKIYRSGSYGEAFGKPFLMENGNLLIQSVTNGNDLDNFPEFSQGIKLFSNKGTYIRGVNLFTGGSPGYGRLHQVDDAHLVSVSSWAIDGIATLNVTKLDQDLAINWNRTYTVATSAIGFTNCTSDNAGNIYIVGSDGGFTANAVISVLKLDPAGNIVWTRAYRATSSQLIFNSSPVATETSLVILSRGATDLSTLSINLSTGAFENSWLVNNVGSTANSFLYDNFRPEYLYGKIYLLTEHQTSSSAVAVYDRTGKMIRYTNLNTAGSLANISVNENGLFLTYGSLGDRVMKIDTALDVVYHTSGIQNNGLVADANGYLFSTGSFTPNSGTTGQLATLIKYDPNGNLGDCFGTLPAPLPQDQVINPRARTFVEINVPPFQIITTIPVTMEPTLTGMNTSDILCSSLPRCTTVDIAGPAEICDLNDNYRFLSNRNPGCDLKVKWIFDTAFAATGRALNDSLDLQFKKTGTTRIIAQLDAGCKLYYDTLEINIQSAPATFSLGQDTVVCPGATVELKADTGFSSYLWSDGSTGESITVNTPGRYYVDVRNSCGDLGSDTIEVRSTVVPLLELGTHTELCIGDSLRLSAGAGFSQFEWTGVTGNTTDQQAFLLPLADGEVSVIAITPKGCRAYDTLYYTTKTARPVILGNDTSFCKGNILELYAGAGFAGYSWSNGSVSPTLSISETGSYSVVVTDQNGCRARDTLQLQLIALPVLNLGADFDLCVDQVRRLDAGDQYTYLWNDGSTGRYLDVSGTGSYRVTVTNSSECVASDTLEIRQVLPNPVNFLPAIDSVCSYEHISLKPSRNYNNYNWSTGSSASSISISSPGQYTLTVTDAKGCTGSDTITIIPKTCYMGVYVPNVFTPNSDGINDTFKAGVWGNVLRFRLQVFNRWGQLVYQTADPSKGWDGKVNGIPQETGVFVWQCTHHIEGQAPGYLKGTVNLVR